MNDPTNRSPKGATAMSTLTKLITAEEFAAMPDNGRPCELVRGEIVEMNIPKGRHGQLCSLIAYLGHQYNERFDRIITERDPDSVRGPDVCFATYERIPKGPLEDDYIEVAPEIAFEVVSPSDRWSEISEKINEYLAAGVLVVCVVEPKPQTVRLFFPDHTSRTLTGDEELTFPEILPEFSVPVRKLFE
jgi:Uma2 family endonuclease